MSDGRILLDASAVLALINDEPGAGEVQSIIGRAVVSSVNAAEVAGKLADHGLTDNQIQTILAVGFDTLPFGAEETAIVPKLRRETAEYGMSLGDRCCLATALTHNYPVLTADRVWAKLKIRGLKVSVLGARQAK